jgi:hypothetical protein
MQMSYKYNMKKFMNPFELLYYLINEIKYLYLLAIHYPKNAQQICDSNVAYARGRLDAGELGEDQSILFQHGAKLQSGAAISEYFHYHVVGRNALEFIKAHAEDIDYIKHVSYMIDRKIHGGQCKYSFARVLMTDGNFNEVKILKIWEIITKTQKFQSILEDSPNFWAVILYDILLKDLHGNNNLYKDEVVKKLAELFIGAGTPIFMNWWTDSPEANLSIPTVISEISKYTIKPSLIFSSYLYTRTQLQKIVEILDIKPDEVFKSTINHANHSLYLNKNTFFYGEDISSILFQLLKNCKLNNKNFISKLISNYLLPKDALKLLKNNIAQRSSVINDDHWYEDLEINTILDARINDFNRTHTGNQINRTHAMAIYDDDDANSNESSIQAVAQGIAALEDFAATIIPLNLNHNHWISAIVQRNANEEYTITITDSLNNMSNETHAQVSQVFNAAFERLDISFNPDSNIYYADSMQQLDASSCGAYAIENAIRFLGGDYYAGRDIRESHQRLYDQDLPERNTSVFNTIKDLICGKKKSDPIDCDYRMFYYYQDGSDCHPDDYIIFYDCQSEDSSTQITLEISVGNQMTTVATDEIQNIYVLFGGVSDPALSFIE